MVAVAFFVMGASGRLGELVVYAPYRRPTMSFVKELWPGEDYIDVYRVVTHLPGQLITVDAFLDDTKSRSRYCFAVRTLTMRTTRIVRDEGLTPSWLGEYDFRSIWYIQSGTIVGYCCGLVCREALTEDGIHVGTNFAAVNTDVDLQLRV